MAGGINNNVGQSGLSYVDQLKQLQDKNKPDETTGKQDLNKKTSYLCSPSSLPSKIRLSRLAMTR